MLKQKNPTVKGFDSNSKSTRSQQAPNDLCLIRRVSLHNPLLEVKDLQNGRLQKPNGYWFWKDLVKKIFERRTSEHRAKPAPYGASRAKPGQIVEIELSELTELIDWSEYQRLLVDAEWFKVLYLCKQFTVRRSDGQPQETVVLWHHRSKPDMSLVAEAYPGHKIYVIYCPSETSIHQVAKLSKNVKVEIFASPRDLEALVGTLAWRAVLTDEHCAVTKRRNIEGEFTVNETTFEIWDWFGAFNKSLDEGLKSVGVNNPWKSVVTDSPVLDEVGNPTDIKHSKDKMELFFDQYPTEGMIYAIGDTYYLATGSLERIKQVNHICKEALKITCEWDLDTFPRSSGSLVAKTWENWLIKKYPNIMKTALLMSDAKCDSKWSSLQKAKKSVHDLEKTNRTLRGSDYLHGMGMASIPAWLKHSPDGTGIYNAIVMGGRCINEEPYDDIYRMILEHVIDMDLSSCYGSALMEFLYPFGIPTIYERKVDDEPITLREWLKRYGKELVPGLYQIVVSGKLDFEQDLIHSKYELTSQKIKRKILNEHWVEEDSDNYVAICRESKDAHIGGNFLVTKTQVENGMITHVVKEAVEKVASNREWDGIQDLYVVTAAYYPKSMQMEPEEWAAHILDPRKRGKLSASGDSRSRHWCAIPIKEFIEPFINYRKEMKRQKKAKGDVHDLLQEATKLFINTFYGDLAAPYFPMGNTILANNITAKARVGVWMLSKALLTVQSITDGGMFSWKRVAFLTGQKKPSLHTLADRRRMLQHRSIKTGPLPGNDNWYDHIIQDLKKAAEAKDREEDYSPTSQVDEACTNHINEFWKPYGLTLPFKLEAKLEHTAMRAAYFGSADYIIEKPGLSDTDLTKVRGAKQADHPKNQWMKHILRPTVNPCPNPFFTYKQQLGLNEFLENPQNYPDILPGYDVLRETVHRPFKYGQLFNTYQEWKREDDRVKKAIKRAQVIETGLSEEDKQTYRIGLAKMSVVQ